VKNRLLGFIELVIVQKEVPDMSQVRISQELCPCPILVWSIFEETKGIDDKVHDYLLV